MAPKDTSQDNTTKQPPNKNAGDNQHHPYQSGFETPFQMMRAIEEDIFQGLSCEQIHTKYTISQDENICILCYFKSNQKRYHHTKDCRDIKARFKLYNTIMILRRNRLVLTSYLILVNTPFTYLHQTTTNSVTILAHHNTSSTTSSSSHLSNTCLPVADHQLPWAMRKQCFQFLVMA